MSGVSPARMAPDCRGECKPLGTLILTQRQTQAQSL